jgi:uncharacterized membrane protein YhaH (DUF805 family)
MFKALGKYAVFSGRAGRKEYWLFQLLMFLYFSIIHYYFFPLSDPKDFEYKIWFILIGILFLIPNYSVSVRRMHDLDKNGSWAIFSTLPVFSFGFMIAACFDGTAGVNRYGPDPKGRGNSLPVGHGDNVAQNTPGTGQGLPVQGEHRLAGLKPTLTMDRLDAGPKLIERGGSGLQSKSPDTHDSKAVDDDLKIHLKELKTLHEEGMIDDDEYKSLKGRALGL